MSAGSSKVRTQRLASITGASTRLNQAVSLFRQKSAIFCCLIFCAAFSLLVILLGVWNPPFPYYEGMAVNRDIVTRVPFNTLDVEATENARLLAANRVPYVYLRNSSPTVLDENINTIYQILKEASHAESFDQLSPELQKQFMVPDESKGARGKTGTEWVWSFLREDSDDEAAPAASPQNSSGTIDSSIMQPGMPSHSGMPGPPGMLNPLGMPNLSGMPNPPGMLNPIGMPDSSGAFNSLGMQNPAGTENGGRNQGKNAAEETLPNALPEVQDTEEEESSKNGDASADGSEKETADAKGKMPEKLEKVLNSDSSKASPEEAVKELKSEVLKKEKLPETQNLPKETVSGVKAETKTKSETPSSAGASGASETPSSAGASGTSETPSSAGASGTSETPSSAGASGTGETPSSVGESGSSAPPSSAKDLNESDISTGSGSWTRHSKQKFQLISSQISMEGVQVSLNSEIQPSDSFHEESVQRNSHRQTWSISPRNLKFTSNHQTDSWNQSNTSWRKRAFGGFHLQRVSASDSLSDESSASSLTDRMPEVSESAALEKALTDFCGKLRETMRPFHERGLMHIAEVKNDPLGIGLQAKISVVDSESAEQSASEPLTLKLCILEENAEIHDALRKIVRGEQELERIYYCICRNWKSNLVQDPTLTNQAIQAARQSVEPIQKAYQISQRIVRMSVEDDVVVGTLLTADMVKLLHIENEKWLETRTWEQKVTRGIAVTLLLLLCLIPIWAYISLEDVRIFKEIPRQVFILSFSIFTLGVTNWLALLSSLPRNSGLFPLILFSQILTIQYQRRVGILFSGMILLCLCVTLGMSPTEVLCDIGILLTAILPIDRLRGRMQFVRISILSSLSAFILFCSADLLMGVPLCVEIFSKALMNSLPLLFAGLVIQSLLPLLERYLGILSDVRLLELCDVSNPLLNELVNRAPSTYSHSIALGTIGENAADAIGANGLLVRTAAYYHDVGKIYIPNYYAENQAANQENPHKSLEPSVSALIIIAHVKNGVNYARQYHLPVQIVDLIEQHHGTTRVAYFYFQAMKKYDEAKAKADAAWQKYEEEKRKAEENGEVFTQAPPPSETIPEVEESSFRYPCSKPQTKEAVVLMMADACESACRALVEPTPARIQGLVRKISQERLEDEQFDETDITLKELRIVEDVIIKGLISYHHGRIKYPETIPARKK